MNTNELLTELATDQLDADGGLPWLQKKLASLASDFKPRTFYLAFSACPRFIEKSPLQLNKSWRERMQSVYPNFGKITWAQDELARVLLMTSLPVDQNRDILEKLFETADYREQVALYKGLYFLENAANFTERAREGLRTNMVGVFDAIALENPLPAEYLSQDAWNQMALKAMFMDRPLYRIARIEDRKNADLARMCIDYAHERWSAHRSVSPELWRFVSGYVDEAIFADIQKTITEGTELERLAAAKALAESDLPVGKNWLQEQGITADELPEWDAIGQHYEQKQAATA
jgi:hypothetical protein